MSWLKPNLEIIPKTNLEFASLNDPNLDIGATDKELIKKYLNGEWTLAKEFIWKEAASTFVCRPLKYSEWSEVQLSVICKIQAKAVEEEEGKVLASRLMCLETFRICFRGIIEGETRYERSEIYSSIPMNVQEEIGQYIIIASNVLSPL